VIEELFFSPRRRRYSSSGIIYRKNANAYVDIILDDDGVKKALETDFSNIIGKTSRDEACYHDQNAFYVLGNKVM
jgi:hypothetical protein